MVDIAFGACAGEWHDGEGGNACVGEFSQPPPGIAIPLFCAILSFFDVSRYCAYFH